MAVLSPPSPPPATSCRRYFRRYCPRLVAYLRLDGRSQAERLHEQGQGSLLAEKLEVFRILGGLSEGHLI